MKLSSNRFIAAKRQDLWNALNNPETLKSCIPGCEQLDENARGELEAIVVARIGPIRAKFKGSVTYLTKVFPESISIEGHGSGGVAGFGKGNAAIRLVDSGDGTDVFVNIEVGIGGKLAQLGSRLVKCTADRMTDHFFDNLENIVTSGSSHHSELSAAICVE